MGRCPTGRCRRCSGQAESVDQACVDLGDGMIFCSMHRAVMNAQRSLLIDINETECYWTQMIIALVP